MTFDRYDVVVVPFPFTDRSVKLRRPAVILSGASFAEASGQSLMAMVTRAENSAWPGDSPVEDLESAGLTSPCVIRMKLFTLVDALIDRKIGRLGDDDTRALRTAVAKHLALSVT